MDLPVQSPDLEAAPALRVFRPEQQTAPLVFASPHSGRDYPTDFVASARLDPLTLRRSEDCFVDELFAAAPANGMPLLAATFPRAFCDPNREPWELDPAMFEEDLPAWVNTTSPRVNAGLGTIARVVASGETIYGHKLAFAEAERRVRLFWEPYHAALAGLISLTLSRFDSCLLIDCHSMPTHGARQGADIVLGDAYGTACSPRITRRVERELNALGYTVRRNDPYAGGYITRHYGRPRDRVHALQLELGRSLYMDESRIERSPRFARLQADLTRLVTALASDATDLLATR